MQIAVCAVDETLHLRNNIDRQGAAQQLHAIQTNHQRGSLLPPLRQARGESKPAGLQTQGDGPLV